MEAAASGSNITTVDGSNKNNNINSSSNESHVSSTETLEVGMSGMNLLSMPEGHSRKETSSTVSSSPPNDYTNSSSATTELKTRAPASPGSPSGRKSGAAQQQQRPPGLSGPLPSPIGKVGTSKNTSATSPSLTLTPNSSVDGNSDWNSIGRQSSPFQEAPSLPFLSNPEHRRGMDGSFGSGELSAGGGATGGLLGALRERSYSSPGGFSSSPPISRGMISAHLLNNNEQGRSSTRPPRGFSQQPEGNIGGFASSSSSSRSDPNNTSMESADSRSFGAIGRPELRQSAAEFDPRSVRSGDMSSTYGGNNNTQGGYYDPHVAQKFGSLPTLGSHLQQQRGFDAFSLPKPRHVRSVSQPGFSGNPQPQDHRYYGGGAGSMAGSNRHSFSTSNVSRITPQQQQAFPNAAQYAKAGSMPNLGGFLPSMQRRDALDFQLSPGGQSSAGSYNTMMSAEDMRAHTAPSMISPGQSPLQTHYASHSRHPSESGILSTSPVSMGSAAMHSNSSLRSNRHSGMDDDLAHPLVGEHIEVPDHEDHHRHQGIPGFMEADAYGGHGYSLSDVPTNYMDGPATHHLPTAGSTLPPPKVVYSVKFKRTQRNFVLGPRISRDLKIGTYVKVEADRGEDLGIVVGKMSADKFNYTRSSYTAGMGPPSGSMGNLTDLKRIIRLATHDEVSLLSMKREEEENLLKICRGKVRQRGLPMHVVDAEYQFDRHKLTFFFEAEGRVDFRELVRDLFSMYKTRIWMQQLDKNTSTSSPAIMAPQTANLQMDYGTPIIAPMSEFADSVVLNGFSNSSGGIHP